MKDTDTDTLLVAFQEYERRLKTKGMTPFDGTSMEAIMVSGEIMQEFGLNFWDLEKVTTALAAERLKEDLIEEHGGYRTLTDLTQFMRRYFAVPNHDRDLASIVLPVVLADCCTEECSKEMLAYAWKVPEWPQRGLEAVWVLAFRSAGFVTDTEDITPPSEAHTLYRGAWEDHRSGMAWTDNLDTARWFARRFDGPGKVWITHVEPDAVMARFTGRNENEWVLDPEHLSEVSLYVPS